MEIQALKLVVVDEEANRLLGEYAPKEGDIQNLRVRFTPEGVVVTGDTKALFVKMGFETMWEMSLVEGHVVVRLTSLKVAGLPAGKFRGLLLKMARDAVAGEAGIVVEEDVVRVDVNAVLQARRLPVTLRLTAIQCTMGVLTVEAG
jgi:hypothetical protein